MSWYGTCGVSNLPITYGEEVALFIIKEFDEGGSQSRNTLGGFTYPDELYNPIVPPVFGEYNDYGTIDNVVDKGNTVLMYLKKAMGIEKSDYEIEDYIRSIERGKEDKYNIMLVHKGIYERVLEELCKYEDWFTDNKTFGEKLEEDMEEYLSNVENYVDTLLKKEFKGKKDCESLRVALINSFIFQGRNLFSIETQHYLRYLRDYKEYEKNSDLKEVVFDFLVFKKAMEFGRKMWTPQSGAGSQMLYFGMADIVSKFTNAKINEYEELDN